MRFAILPTMIDGTDEKGDAVKISIYVSPSKMSIDSSEFVIHEELLPPELKKHVLKAVDLENTVTLKSEIAAGKVLATKARAWMETAAWKVTNVVEWIEGIITK